MRCGCPECGGYMTHSEGHYMGCVCAVCGYKCSACLGTNTVISKDALRDLKGDDFFEQAFTHRSDDDID